MGAAGWGTKGWGQSISAPLGFFFLLTFFPCSSMGSPPQDTVLDELLQRGSVPPGAVLQKQLLPRRSPMGCSSCQKTCSWVGSPPQATAAGACSGTCSPWLQFTSRHLHRLQCGSVPPRCSPGAAGESLLRCLEHLLPLLLHPPWCP